VFNINVAVNVFRMLGIKLKLRNATNHFNYFVICHLLLKHVSKFHTMALCLTAKIEDDEDSYVLYYLTARYKLIT